MMELLDSVKERQSLIEELEVVRGNLVAYKSREFLKKLQKAKLLKVLELREMVNMDDPNITMKEYIRLEEEKARRRAIVFNDKLTSEEALSCEPTVSYLNNEIDFRVSFDESDDEDYTPTLSYFDGLDFFKDFENEFPAIVYNDALTSKSDFSNEHTLSPQHIDEFDLKDETSLSECDEEEQNVLYFNDVFPFNVIYPDDSKSDKDNDDDKIDIKHSSGDMSVKPLPDLINTDVGAYAHGSNKLLEIIIMEYLVKLCSKARILEHKRRVQESLLI
ncbi:hypothetical protein Tco_0756402 [Tanacetum coccineum]